MAGVDERRPFIRRQVELIQPRVHVRVMSKHYAGVKPAAVATSLRGQPRDSRFLAVRRYLAVP